MFFSPVFTQWSQRGYRGLCIYTKDESAEISVMGATRTVQRELNLMVEGYVKTATNLDDTLDQIGKEIEVAMAGDIGLNSLADDSYLSSVETSYSAEGETPFGIIRYNYSVIYSNAENAPDAAV